MVVTSVVTYTFPIGPFLGAPSSRYGPSVDWGVGTPKSNYFILNNFRICKNAIMASLGEDDILQEDVVEQFLAQVLVFIKHSHDV